MVHSCEIAHALGVELTHADEGNPSGQPPTNDCDHCNFCQTLDAGAVMLSGAKVLIPSAVADIPLREPRPTVLVVDLTTSVTGQARSDPHSLPQRWQFTERTALPPRAPSVFA